MDGARAVLAYAEEDTCITYMDSIPGGGRSEGGIGALQALTQRRGSGSVRQCPRLSTGQLNLAQTQPKP